MDLQMISSTFGFIADTIAIIGIPYTAWQLYRTRQKEKQRQQEIGIQLNCTISNKSIKLPVNIKRHSFTRAEILGYLGMAVKKGDRFNLGYLKTSDFFLELKRIQDATVPETLIIPCGTMENGENEFDQFDPSIPPPEKKKKQPWRFVSQTDDSELEWATIKGQTVSIDLTVEPWVTIVNQKS